MPSRTRLATTAPTLVLAALLTACAAETTGPVAPDVPAPSFAKSGSATVADVVAGDLTPAAGDAAVLASTCPATTGAPGWTVNFGKSQCLLVDVSWEGTAYQLTDDVVLQTLIEKGKNGRITHVRLVGQDVDGAAGIWHNTDHVPVAQPVVPAREGFTLHVHARNVPVYRYDSHLGDGQRVGIVGYISIGDIVYRQP